MAEIRDWIGENPNALRKFSCFMSRERARLEKIRDRCKQLRGARPELSEHEAMGILANDGDRDIRDWALGRRRDLDARDEEVRLTGFGMRRP